VNNTGILKFAELRVRAIGKKHTKNKNKSPAYHDPILLLV
jgi:hypothetical protein